MFHPTLSKSGRLFFAPLISTRKLLHSSETVRRSLIYSLKNSVLIRFIQYRQARGCASPFCRNINKTLNGLYPLQRCMGGK